MQLPDWIEKDAHFSSPQHRVWLRRRLGGLFGNGRPLVMILHNPSTAGADADDPTSRRGIGFAHTLGYSELVFVNAATAIATDANDLVSHPDPIGPMADEALHVAAEFCRQREGILVAAWGSAKGRARTRALMEERFAHIRQMGLPLHALRLTAGGSPEHPLYLPKDLVPFRWDTH